MSELLKKLNVLIKSGLHGEDKQSHAAAQPRKDLERELETLRGRITDAVKHEMRIKAQLREIDEDILKWDQAADDALRANVQDEARSALEKLRAAKRRYARLEDDLHQHEVLTQELIQSVNLLEGAVNQARQTSPTQSTSPDRSMVEVLKQAREKIAALGEIVPPQAETDIVPEQREIEDDLERRRQRLSRR